MSLKELIARDITGIFMNVNDFCDNLSIQIGRKKFNVIGSLQSNTVTNNSGNSSPLQSDTWVLYTAQSTQVVNYQRVGSGSKFHQWNKSMVIKRMILCH